MVETEGKDKNSLAVLIAPYATESSLVRLYYDTRKDRRDYREPYRPALVENVAVDLVGKIRTLVDEQPSIKPADIEAELFKHFLSKCGEEQSIKVAASLIAHNNGAYYKLDTIGQDFRLPFSIDEECQRRLLRAAVQFEFDNLTQALVKQQEGNPKWEGIAGMKKKIETYREYLKQIDEKVGGPVPPGQLV